MACAAMATAVPFGLRYSPSCSFKAHLSRGSVQLAQFNRPNSLRLSSSHSISGLASLLPHRLCTIASSPVRPRSRSLTIVSAKGYKMKTHKASAKRFRVTGRGKIVRRRAGKQHLLVKKNAKRRTRLSKMHEVSRSDYNNVIGALPYLKVNRKAE
ncbi:50S ribosomal protein L35 chloroplastic [Prunus yedoensis var. nudiflora]|uniref:50S ribosomal protein L35 n=1 Tax=Prunus yedoensis var. nudiflora TaxID=2094558 RepID=A0A314YLN5_PRUYE|nr:50S ribosomal protein L35 chloroplastic [Prunus yedoensis var. nudiflora]